MDKTNTLLLHPEDSIRELLRFTLECEFNFNVIAHSSVAEVELALNGNSIPAALFAWSKGKDGDSQRLLELSTQKNIPFFSLDQAVMQAWRSSDGKGASGQIQKEELISGIRQMVNDHFTIQSQVAQDDYTAVSFAPMMYLDRLIDDVFIKLKTGRYLKLFQKGDQIVQEDVERYRAKGIETLYLRREAYQWVLKSIEKAMPALLSDPHRKVVVTVEESLNEEALVVTPDELPVMDQPVLMPRDFINELHANASKVLTQFKKNKEFAKLLTALSLNREENLYFKNRISLVCNISCALAKQLDWGRDIVYEKLIYVAHIHDMTLLNHPRLCKIQIKEELDAMTELSDSERALFLSHPTDVAKIVANDSRAPQDAEIIVLQHHERSDRTGFPNKISGSRIIPLAGLLQISIDFAQYILSDPKWSFSEFEMRWRTKYQGVPFGKIMRGLEGLMNEK